MGTSATLSSGYESGDVVTCTVTPSDGTDSGTALSDSVTVGNTAPEITEVTLSPSTVYTDDTITASGLETSIATPFVVPTMKEPSRVS